MFAIVLLQQRRRADIASLAVRRFDQIAQNRLARQTEVEPMRGHGVHTDRRVTNQCKTGAVKTARMRAHQRIAITLADHFYVAQTVVDALGNVLRQCLVV